MRLSYRDKIILTVAVIVITLLLGVLLIVNPKVTQFNSAKEVLSTKIQTKTEIDTKIAAAQNIDQKIQDAYQEGIKIADFFMPQMNTYQVDQFLLPYFTASKLTINEMLLSEPEVNPVENYIYELKKPIYPLLEASDLNGELDYSTFAGIEGEYQEVVKISATVEFSFRDLNDVFKLLDEMDNIPKSVVVTTLEKGESKDDPNNSTGSVVIDFYSVRPISEPNLG